MESKISDPSSAALTAVILAAGMGERLRSVHAEKPKGFVAVGGEPIIARSLRILQSAGIREIVLVAGWRENIYRDFLRENFPTVRVALNENFATTGSLASLVIGAQGIRGDILLLESDLVYEARAVAALLRAQDGVTLLASGPTGGGDEVWVYGEGERLAHLSKQAWAGAPRLGELVGITRLASESVRALLDVAPTLPASAHYEDGLNAICSRIPVQVLKLDDLAWGEIDDAQHLARVRATVWPRIMRSDQQEVAVTK